MACALGPFKAERNNRMALAFFCKRGQNGRAELRHGVRHVRSAPRPRASDSRASTLRAHDLVQDTLVRALRAEHLFHGGDLRTWLFTILLNLDRNRRRGLARRPVLAVIEEVEPPGAPGSDGSARDISRGL